MTSCSGPLSMNVVGTIAEEIERTVAGWDGVTVSVHPRGGGRQFSFGRVELGHIHGDRFADLPFPRKVRDELIEQGRASVHDPLPDSGWVRKWIEGSDDVAAVIELFRLNYDRLASRR